MARDPLVLAEEPSSWTADGGALDPLVGPQCSLAVQLRRASGDVIGRTAELAELEAPPGPPPSVAFVAPFDSFLWDTKLLASLFDFEFVWEGFFPPA